LNSLGERIKKAREQKDLTQEELAKLINIKNRSTLASWEINRREPDYDTLKSIAKELKVSIEWLLTGKNGNNSRHDTLAEYPGTYITIGHTVKVPIVGVIRAGDPIFADQNIIDYEDVPESEVKDGEYFYLIVTGDSMTGSRIQPGDKVLVRKQEYLDNGQIAVVLVNTWKNLSFYTQTIQNTNLKFTGLKK